MKQSIIDRLKPKMEFWKNLLDKIISPTSSKRLSKSTGTKLDLFIKHLDKLPQNTKEELNIFIKNLKRIPKQSDVQLRTLIKALKHLPSITRKELTALVEHLVCFPKPTKQELNALVKHTQYIPERMSEHTDILIKQLRQLVLLTAEQAEALLADIKNKELPAHIKNDLIAFVECVTLNKRIKFIENIKHLKKSSQEELIVLTDLIKQHISGCGMIILFGSYAKGKEVIYDEYYVRGVLTSYQSDFDIMIVMPNTFYKSKTYWDIERWLDDKVTKEYDKIFSDKRHPPPQFIVENIVSLNKNLKKKQPFFTDIVAEGIILYDNGTVTLPEPQELSFKMIKKNAEEQYEECIEYADEFLVLGRITCDRDNLKMAAFQFHQACENYYRAMGAVFDNYSPKLHKLKVFISKTKCYSIDLESIFPKNTAFEKNTFKLLCEAYIRARYDPTYVVTKEELTYMQERIEVLKDIAKRLCIERIEYYDIEAKNKNLM